MYPQPRHPRAPAAGPSILIVGAGALGCSASAVLARARAGRLTILDPDRVERVNLATQSLYEESDVGSFKAAALATKLGSLGASAAPLVGRLERGNAQALVGEHDFVVDACDDPPTKFLINAVAVETATGYCYGGVGRTGGLCMRVAPGVSACLACVFGVSGGGGEPPDAAGCHHVGVLSPVASVVGSWQALEAMAALGLVRNRPAGRLAVYELRGRRWRFVRFRRDDRCEVCAEASVGTQARRAPTCRS